MLCYIRLHLCNNYILHDFSVTLIKDDDSSFPSYVSDFKLRVVGFCFLYVHCFLYKYNYMI